MDDAPDFIDWEFGNLPPETRDKIRAADAEDPAAGLFWAGCFGLIFWVVVIGLFLLFTR